MRLSKSLPNREQMLMALLVTGVCVMAVFPELAFAGTDGEEFGKIWDTIAKWIQGGLGRLICGSMMLVGAIAGVARQSLMTFGVGIGGGLALYNLPSIVKLVVTATVSSAAFGAEVLEMFSNGLL